MDYSPVNPMIWAIFIAFCIVAWIVVKLFHSRYPEYPDYPDQNEEKKIEGDELVSIQK